MTYPVQASERAEFVCNACGTTGVGDLVVERLTNSMWSDETCDNCGSSDLDWSDEYEEEEDVWANV